jgi:hypothetical protein
VRLSGRVVPAVRDGASASVESCSQTDPISASAQLTEPSSLEDGLCWANNRFFFLLFSRDSPSRCKRMSRSQSWNPGEGGAGWSVLLNVTLVCNFGENSWSRMGASRTSVYERCRELSHWIRNSTIVLAWLPTMLVDWKRRRKFLAGIHRCNGFQSSESFALRWEFWKSVASHFLLHIFYKRLPFCIDLLQSRPPLSSGSAVQGRYSIVECKLASRGAWAQLTKHRSAIVSQLSFLKHLSREYIIQSAQEIVAGSDVRLTGSDRDFLVSSHSSFMRFCIRWAME